ncbi:DUF3153 domain-containing protein [Paenibacillus xylaniclasticus]|uniref:DUF3153 domain-containing protein n=1 Tax=Paenibacillus xylaniclasticus TaxID=588083 RepID=UPI0013E06055|nr:MULTISPECIES: DUF3153 domain-containing protein [Paenibacillus]GFN33240.1 hypothetical protein PCURB6_35000 [Paenibacillus curdlanolyticus]
MTVKANGTSRLDLSIVLSGTALKAIADEKLLDQLSERLSGEGFTVEPIQTGDGQQSLRASKAINLSNRTKAPIPGIVVEREQDASNWFFTKEQVTATTDWQSLIPNETLQKLTEKLNSLSPLVRSVVLRQLSFDFKLTLPIPAKSHNADTTLDSGRTLVWHLSLTKPNSIKVAVNVPNVRHIIMAAGAVLILAIASAAIIVRRRRNKLRQ